MKKLTYFAFLLTMLVGCSDNKPTLEIYSWSDYIDPELIQKFEVENDCHVNVTSFDSNEAMYAKLKAGATGYDILVPSSYMIPLLIKENIITPINHSLIPNVTENFDHGFDSQIIDPELNFSVPYIVNYAGIMYDKKQFKNSEISWDVFSNRNLIGKLSLLDDMREVIGIGLMYNGYSINSENKDEIDKSVETILKWRDNIRKFDAESYKTEVASGSIYFGHGYSSDAFQVIIGDEENGSRDDIGFLLPKEGFTIACDEFVITKTSLNKELAHKFINFIYDVENSKASMEYNVSPMPNSNAIKILDEKLKNLVIMDENTIKRGQVLKQLKNNTSQELYNSAWDKIRSIKK